jgi:hypothetical protein
LISNGLYFPQATNKMTVLACFDPNFDREGYKQGYKSLSKTYGCTGISLSSSLCKRDKGEFGGLVG